MAEKISFEFNGTPITLEFSRNTIRTMEQAGFDIDELGSKPTVRIPQLFQGAFLLHHRRMDQNTINTIWNRMKRKTELVEKLQSMYYETVSTLMDEPEDDEKNIDW